MAPAAAARLLEGVGAVPGLLLPTGRTARLYRGDLVVVACGSLDGAAGPAGAEIAPEDAALLTAGGLAGRAPIDGPAPTALVPLARLADAEGRPLGLEDAAVGPGLRSAAPATAATGWSTPTTPPTASRSATTARSTRAKG